LWRTVSSAPAADSFTYKASDGAAQSGPATVTITVQAVNDAPAVVSDSYTSMRHHRGPDPACSATTAMSRATP
jgi:VCBS repeat-containing protein